MSPSILFELEGEVAVYPIGKVGFHAGITGWQDAIRRLAATKRITSIALGMELWGHYHRLWEAIAGFQAIGRGRIVR